MFMTLAIATLSAFAEPPLPRRDDTVNITAQEWEFAPGPREIKVYVHYPGGVQENVMSRTGLMLCLHNWGGTGSDGAPDPVQVAKRYNVISISVDYLQSGEYDPAAGIPYDFGYLQALDALRALYYVFHSLDEAKIAFARGRIYATGGSGGGNVALMANKLAPRTFACVVDISGMAKLTDDIAYGLPGGSDLNAGYSRDEASRAYLSRDAQEIRDVGNREHLIGTRELRRGTKVVVIHGADDPVCPVIDVLAMVKNLDATGVDTTLNLISKRKVDGQTIKDTGHALGDRTRILFKFADRFLLSNSRALRVRRGESDFESRDNSVQYRTRRGVYEINYRYGYPIGSFYPVFTLFE